MDSKGTDDAGLRLVTVVELVAAAAAATAPNEEELSVEFDPCRSLIVDSFRCWFINDPNNKDVSAATCIILAALDLVFVVFFIVVDPSI